MLAFTVGACTDDFEDDLIDTKNPTVVPATALFSNAQRNLVDQMTTPNVNSGIFRLLSQQWANTTYPEESRYDLVNRSIPQNFWFTLYRDVLMDLREAKIIITADETFQDANQKANQLAITEIMEVYTWQILVDTYGDIPYTEALDPDNVYPAYDDAAEIYDDLFTRLDAALATLNAGEGSASFGGADLIYNGNVSKWIKFGNSLKLKMAVTIADVEESQAKAAAEAAAPHVFTSISDNAAFAYTPATPNVNPIWSNLVQSKRNDFVAANTIIDIMNELNDPRRDPYFTEVEKGGYVGGTYGDYNTYSVFSHVDPVITAPDFEALLMSYSEVEFYLAEAAARNFDVSGSAESHYNAGIRASMRYWGVPQAEINAYLAQPDVNYTSALAAADGGWREVIGLQEWIAFYNRGWEAWTTFRRLDYPQLQAPAAEFNPEFDVVPTRYTYPETEAVLNRENYQSVANEIEGGDVATSRVFWDVD